MIKERGNGVEKPINIFLNNRSCFLRFGWLLETNFILFFPFLPTRIVILSFFLSFFSSSLCCGPIVLGTIILSFIYHYYWLATTKVHYALSNGANPPIIDCLLKHRPNSARGFDKRGWTPLHVACGVGADLSVIRSIVDCYPEAVLMRTNKGSTAWHCLNLTYAANKRDVKLMLQHIYTEVERRYRLVKVKSATVLVWFNSLQWTTSYNPSILTNWLYLL